MVHRHFDALCTCRVTAWRSIGKRTMMLFTDFPYSSVLGFQTGICAAVSSQSALWLLSPGRQRLITGAGETKYRFRFSISSILGFHYTQDHDG